MEFLIQQGGGIVRQSAAERMHSKPRRNWPTLGDKFDFDVNSSLEGKMQKDHLKST